MCNQCFSAVQVASPTTPQQARLLVAVCPCLRFILGVRALRESSVFVDGLVRFHRFKGKSIVVGEWCCQRQSCEIGKYSRSQLFFLFSVLFLCTFCMASARERLTSSPLRTSACSPRTGTSRTRASSPRICSKARGKGKKRSVKTHGEGRGEGNGVDAGRPLTRTKVSRARLILPSRMKG